MKRLSQLFKILFALCIFGGQLTAPAEQIIREGDTWRYFPGRSLPGENWTKTGFDDSSWNSGPSGFGYGDNDDATVLKDMSDKTTGYASVFIRKYFEVANPADIKHLNLAADYDDGFVAYVNGIEVARRNMPPGPVTNTTLASDEHEASRGDGASDPQEKEFIAVDPKLLVPGKNVIAVSGHNVAIDSTDLSLIVELYIHVTLTRGPFIQMPNPDEVTVVWGTDAPTDSVVEYGSDKSCKEGRVSSPTLVREHTVNIPHLTPGNNYFYRVRSGGATLSEGDFFKTKRNESQPFRFAVIGDWGSGNDAMRNVAQQVNAADVDFIITVGDNIYDSGQPGLYDRYLAAYAPTMRRAPMFPALGDHDIQSANGKWMLTYFRLPQNGPRDMKGRNYSFDYGNAHFMALDSTAFELEPINRESINTIKRWAFRDLAETAKLWRFAFMHNPPITSESVHHEAYNTRTMLLPIFEGAGMQMLFAGHNHFYERLGPVNGISHIITGGGGRVLYQATKRRADSVVLADKVHSFTLVEVKGRELTLRQIDENGKQLDEFQLNASSPDED